MESEILAKVIRGETLESVHRGHLIVVDGEGNDRQKLGNPGNGNVFSFVGEGFSGDSFYPKRRG